MPNADRMTLQLLRVMLVNQTIIMDVLSSVASPGPPLTHEEAVRLRDRVKETEQVLRANFRDTPD